MMNNDRIDDLLTRHYARGKSDDGAGARVIAKLGVLPPQKHRLWTRIPGILLDWQFAPAWPRMAALACCAALGFAVGAAGLDRLGGPFAVSANNDLAAAVFEPEPLTGVRP
jgi:hypothetical protein